MYYVQCYVKCDIKKPQNYKEHSTLPNFRLCQATIDISKAMLFSIQCLAFISTFPSHSFPAALLE